MIDEVRAHVTRAVFDIATEIGIVIVEAQPEGRDGVDTRVVIVRKSGAVSAKPRNYIVNWRRVVSELPGKALEVAGATALGPSWVVIAILDTLRSVGEGLLVPLSSHALTVLEAIAAHGNGRAHVPIDDLYSVVATFLRDSDRECLSHSDVIAAISELEQCKILHMNEGQYEIIEVALYVGR